MKRGTSPAYISATRGSRVWRSTSSGSWECLTLWTTPEPQSGYGTWSVTPTKPLIFLSSVLNSPPTPPVEPTWCRDGTRVRPSTRRKVQPTDTPGARGAVPQRSDTKDLRGPTPIDLGYPAQQRPQARAGGQRLGLHLTSPTSLARSSSA